MKQLSGGERKRVALARALLSDPEVLLLDEPLAGVDVALRDRVLEYLVRVRDEFPIPTVYVTHQMEEVEAICEEIVVLERGRVVARRPLAGRSSGRWPESTQPARQKEDRLAAVLRSERNSVD